MNTGKKIERIVKEQGIALRQLALTAEIPYNTLYAIVKRDSAKVNEDTIHRLAIVLGVTEDELQPDSDEKSTSAGNEDQAENKDLELQYVKLAASTGFGVSRLNALPDSDLSDDERQHVDYCKRLLYHGGEILKQPPTSGQVFNVNMMDAFATDSIDKILNKIGKNPSAEREEWLLHIAAIIVRYARLTSAGRKELVKRLGELERLEEYRAPEIPSKVKRKKIKGGHTHE